MDNTKLLGKKIKDYRKRNMMTLQQLAEKSGISAGYISKIERGTVNSSLKNIQKLCEVLDTTTDELMKDCFQQKEYEEIQIDNYFIFTKMNECQYTDLLVLLILKIYIQEILILR